MNYNDYTDYNPEVLRVTAFQIPPWIIVKTNGSSLLEMKGPLMFLLQYLSSSMKFRYEIVNNPEYKFAHGKFVNNTWVGLLGLLHRNAVDFTIVPAGPNPLRCNASRMPLPFAYSDMTILSGRHLGDDPQGVATFDNMSLEVWLCYITCFLVSAFVSWVSEGSASVCFHWSTADSYKHKFLRFCWEFIGCVFSKEIRLPMRKLATRMILAMWLFGGLIITTIIGGDMTASMAIIPPEFTIDKLSDIMLKPNLRADIMAFSGHMAYVEEDFPYSYAQSRISIILMRLSIPLTFIGNDTNPVFLNYQFVKANNPFLALKITLDQSGAAMPILMKPDKFQDIASMKAVQINDRFTLLSAVKKYCEGEPNIRGFYFAKNLITEVPVSMFFNKRLSKKFMDQVNIRMLRIFQHGIVVDWLRPATKISPTCFFQPESGEYAPLEIDHVYPAFKLWFQGLLFASSFFVLEFFISFARVVHRDGINRPRIVLSNVKFKLTRTCCRTTVPRTRGIDSFVSKYHQQRKLAALRQTSPTYYGKMTSPSDFQRILWRGGYSDRFLARRPIRDSVVNRSSTVPPTEYRHEARTNSTSGYFSRFTSRPKSNEKIEPVIRYVDTSAFFDNLY